jgi:hypothetical protein
MVGMHHVFRPADPFWIHLGGAFGFPLLRTPTLETLATAQGLWDLQHFGTALVPFSLRLAVEGHAGLFEFRVDVDPVWGISIAGAPSFPFQSVQTTGHLFALQHALEVQLGHAIGGGLRYQGVLIATNNDALGTSGPEGDHYQGCFEPFFRLYHDPLVVRLGLLMPVDPPLGGAFQKSWGVRASMGFSLD